MLSFKKCPICSSPLRDGECLECGYVLPAEELLDEASAVYNFDPDDYPEPQKAMKKNSGVRTFYKEAESDDIRMKSLRIVDGNAVVNGSVSQPLNNPNPMNAQPKMNNMGQNNAGQMNGQQMYGTGYVPYTPPPTPIQRQMQNNNMPYGGYVPPQSASNGNSFGRRNGKDFLSSLSDLVGFRVQLALSVIFPIIGFVFAFSMMRSNKPEAKRRAAMLFLLAIIRIIL